MTTLHVLSHSPFVDSRLASCLQLLGPGDGLLFCGEAVYTLQPGTDPYKAIALAPSTVALYAMDEDLKARGLVAPERFQTIDYRGFVAISCRFKRVNSWL